MIILSSGELTVKSIIKPTKASFFKDLVVGSKVEFSMQLKYTGRGRSGMYSPMIRMMNLTTGAFVNTNFGSVKHAECFELEVLK